MCKTDRIPTQSSTPAKIPTSPSTRPTEPEKTRHGLGHLALCALGICICYLYYGILQERLFTGRERLGASFVLATQCITNALVAYIWQQVQPSDNNNNNNSSAKRTRTISTTPNHGLMFLTSGFYVAAMVFSNEAIQYVSYPVAVLAKSCKLIPTMLVGQIMEGKLYSSAEWSAALLISMGIVLFHWSRHHGGMSHENGGSDDDDDQSTYGMLLLSGSLAMDGVLSSMQNFLKFPRNKAAYRAPTAEETMLYMNLYAVVYLFPLCLHNGQWTDGVARLSKEESLVSAVLILNATVALGQIFIFLCLTWFSPLYTTTITTTRKFLTVVVSVVMFGHSFTPTQWLSVCLVFAGLYLIIVVQRNKKAVVKAKAD